MQPFFFTKLSYCAFSLSCKDFSSVSEQFLSCAESISRNVARSSFRPFIRSAFLPVSVTSVIMLFSRKYIFPSTSAKVKLRTSSTAGIMPASFSVSCVRFRIAFVSFRLLTAFSSCSERSASSIGTQAVSSALPYIENSMPCFIVPSIISGWSRK